jgi:AraC-like DNA-binding protein
VIPVKPGSQAFACGRLAAHGLARRRMIVSRQRWTWGEAEVERDRALWPSWTLRRVSFRGLRDDERPLLGTIGRGIEESRARLSVVLDGRFGVWSGGASRELGRGDALFVAPVSDAPGCNLGGEFDAALEVEWRGSTPRAAATAFRLPEAVFAEAAALAEALRRCRADASPALAVRAQAFLRRIRALGIAVPAEAPAGTPESEDQRVMSATDDILSRLDQRPQSTDLESRLRCSRWTVTRLFHHVHAEYAMCGIGGATDWRSVRDYHRLRIARMLMTHRRSSTGSVARYVGYGSAEAMCHAFANAGLPSPGRLRESVGRAC